MQSINTNVQSSYTPSIATTVFECEDLQNVLCSYLTPLQNTNFLSTNKTLEPARWTKTFSFGKDKVKVAALKELIHEVNSLEAAKKECEKIVIDDGRTLCRKASIDYYSEPGFLFGKINGHNEWDFMTTSLFKEIIISQFKMVFESGVIFKNKNFEGTSIARIKLQALSWLSSSAWEAEQMLRNSENLEFTSKKLDQISFDIFLQYPSVKQNKNRGECPISNKVFFDLMKKANEIKNTKG